MSEIVMGNFTELRAENERLRAQIETAKEALAIAERMLVKIGAALPSSVVQKMPTKLLVEWESVEQRARAALTELENADD